jgi:hypothetical protein
MVGHINLTNTYRRISEETSDLGVHIIDAAIKLDHFDRIPDKELGKIKGRVGKNHCAFSVVRDLVADVLYFYNLEFPLMQKLGAEWEIKVQMPKYLGNRSKK